MDCTGDFEPTVDRKRDPWSVLPDKAPPCCAKGLIRFELAETAVAMRIDPARPRTHRNAILRGCASRSRSSDKRKPVDDGREEISRTKISVPYTETIERSRQRRLFCFFPKCFCGKHPSW